MKKNDAHATIVCPQTYVHRDFACCPALYRWIGVRPKCAPLPAVPAPPSVAAKSYVLMDADTDHIIAERNSDASLHPASLTKIMTGYVAAGELQSRRVSMDDEVMVSVNAWQTPGSRMFIREGTHVKVADLFAGHHRAVRERCERGIGRTHRR